jgi:glycosyltransferase involved in cell wall biosynthesis
MPDLPRYARDEMATFDVVHLNGYRTLMNLPVAKAARLAEVPLVMQPHGGMQVIVNTLLIKRLYDRFLGKQELKGLSAVIVGQESERQQAMGLGVPADRIEIIPNGMAMTDLAEIPGEGTFRSRFGIPEDKPLILFLGRINRKKGVDMLVDAFRRLDGLDAYLAIVGPDDGQMAEVKRLVAQYGMASQVVLTGLLTGADVLAAYRDADLFVLPCRTDTFPMTIIEACLAGTPMVITDRCESAYLVHGRVADVVPFDADAFALAMKRLLTDRERYARYRDACPEVMRNTFSLEIVVDRLEALYNRVVAER